MTGRVAEPGWSRRLWVAMVGAILGCQLIAIRWLSDDTPIVVRPVPPQLTATSLFLEPPSPGLERLFELADPTVFALPSARGFAGTAWRIATDPAPDTSDWVDSNRWLAASGRWLVARPRVGPPERGPLSSLDPSTFLSRPKVAVVTPPLLPLPAKTEVELDPGLRARGLIVPVAAPDVVHSNTLTSTELRVCVEPSGAVFSAVVLKGSGLAAADQLALESVSKARFKPLDPPPAPGSDPGAGLDWGRMVFRWHTTAPSTNGKGT